MSRMNMLGESRSGLLLVDSHERRCILKEHISTKEKSILANKVFESFITGIFTFSLVKIQISKSLGYSNA